MGNPNFSNIVQGVQCTTHKEPAGEKFTYAVNGLLEKRSMVQWEKCDYEVTQT